MTSVSSQIDNLIETLENNTETSQKSEGRDVLPTNVTPTHYLVSITPDLVTHFRFLGRVVIDLRINEDTTSIQLNSLDLTFDDVLVSVDDKRENIPLKNISFDEERGVATVKLNNKILANTQNVQLIISFVGILNDKMKGFYRSKYKRSNGNVAYCGCTQFEATDARRAFPCWDEPGVKSKFTVELTVASDLACLSNMNIAEKVENGNIISYKFEPTPIMSTYLLAWFIGEFEYVESKTSRDIVVRVWTEVGKKETGKFALDCACRCLDFYEKYFNIQYPLPKCDMIACPDFAAGAMENWGLITYREIALLADSKTASLRQLRYVAIVVCHELAHQWFGNLVTMEWWSQLWLNEGFAAFMEYLSSQACYPEWPMWNLFITSEYSRAFELDGMDTSHPIEVDVKTAHEAEEVFDAISYCKGASVIRMLQGWIGDKAFQLGLTNYLNNFKYKNATTNDLWRFLSESSKKPVANVMTTWTRQQGFPLIEASINNNKLVLKQRLFISSGRKLNNNENKRCWSVPIQLKCDNKDEIIKILFTKKEQTFDIPKNTKWLHINANSIGFYVCQYDINMMNNISNALKNNDKKLNTIDKVCLVRDINALSTSGIKDATQNLLALLISFESDLSYPVWDAILTGAGEISHVIDNNNNIRQLFDNIMQRTLVKIFNKINLWGNEETYKKEDDDITSLVRPLIIGGLGKYGHKKVINECLNRFRKYIKLINENNDKEANKIMPSNLRASVYPIAIKYGNKNDFNLLKKYYLNASDPAERTWSLRALGYTKDESLINELLDWCLNNEQVKPQDKIFPVRVVASTIVGRDIAYNFVKKNFDSWLKLFDGGFLVQHLVKLPNNFVSFQKADEIEKWYNTVNQPSAARSMKQCVENIRKYAQWQRNDLKLIEQWCKQNQN